MDFRNACIIGWPISYIYQSPGDYTREAVTADSLSHFMHRAAPGFELWFGVKLALQALIETDVQRGIK